MRLQVWYPAKTSTGSKAPYLVDDGLLRAMKESQYLDLPSDLLEQWGNLQTHATIGAPIVAKPGLFPLVIFSPGFGVSRVNYTAIAEQLASHGFIVITVDHPYAGLTVFPDGRVLLFSAEGGSEDALRKRVEDMARDVYFILDALSDGRKALGTFAGRIDKKRIAAAGHSLGGMTALEALHQDRRLAVAVDLDGSPVGRVTLEGLEKPILVMLNQPDQEHRPPERMKLERHKEWSDLIEKKKTTTVLMTIINTTHMSFTDATFLVPPERLARSGAVIDGKRLLEIIARAMLAFTSPTATMERVIHTESAARAYSEVTVETFNLGAKSSGVTHH